jgi:hypothetical protein
MIYLATSAGGRFMAVLLHRFRLIRAPSPPRPHRLPGVACGMRAGPVQRRRRNPGRRLLTRFRPVCYSSRSGFSPKGFAFTRDSADTRHHRSTIKIRGNNMPANRLAQTSPVDHELSPRRFNIMRLGYAFMGVGLAIVKWPILVQNVSSLPVFEGVVACLLTAMSLLAFLGLRYPVRMLPILLFEVLWKVIWIAAVALPHLVADDIDTATREVLVNCSLVVIVIAVIPWRYVWEHYIRAPADAWR